MYGRLAFHSQTGTETTGIVVRKGSDESLFHIALYSFPLPELMYPIYFSLLRVLSDIDTIHIPTDTPTAYLITYRQHVHHPSHQVSRGKFPRV